MLSVCMFTQIGGKQVQALDIDQNNAIIEELSLSLFQEGDSVIQLFMGNSLSTALTESGKFFAWGSNYPNVPTEIIYYQFPEGDKIIQLALGFAHSSALTESGKVFTWGNNVYGQLGDGTTNDKIFPTEITNKGDFSDLDTGDKVIQLSVGAFHSSALTESGKVFTWGRNTHGQLGDGTTDNSNIPIEITGTEGTFPALTLGDKVIELSMGGAHSSALTSDGKVFTWGYNWIGQLGTGDTTDRHTPIEITSSFNLTGDKIIQLSMGSFNYMESSHSSALTESGKVFTWGGNNNGQLGDGTTDNSNIPTEITNKGDFSDLDTGDKVIELDMGAYHSSALTSDGKVFTWGVNWGGRLGDDTTTNKHTPTDITNKGDFSELDPGDKVIQLSMGSGHSSALTSDGKVFTWGWNNFYQLGDGENINKHTPSLVQSISPPPIIKIFFNSMGGTDILDIIEPEGTNITAPDDPTKTGYTFNNWYSDIELTTVYTFSTMPSEDITLFAKWDAIEYDITYALDGGTNSNNNPATYTIESVIDLAPATKIGYTFDGWFDAASGGIEITTIDEGSTENKTLYAQWIPINFDSYTFDSEDPVIQISMGGSHSSALTEKGIVYTWGRNNYGQLGNNSTTNAHIPINITDNFSLDANDKVIQISAGYNHSAALTADGRVFMWGINQFGQLGNDDSDGLYRSTPIEITNSIPLEDGDKIIQLSATGNKSSALTENGKVFMWGYRESGQGTADSHQLAPLNITDRFELEPLDKVIQISIGHDHSSALTKSGRVFMWGYNWFGQLGTGHTINAPREIFEITSRFGLNVGDKVIHLSMGANHSSALTESGKVFTWGRNLYGQLGDGTTTDINTPTEITNNGDFSNLADGDKIIQLSMGYRDSGALTEYGNVFMWGSNTHGQLGNNSVTKSSIPINITDGFGLAEGDKVTQLSLGDFSSSALTFSDKVFMWGENAHGNLGYSNAISAYIPMLLQPGVSPQTFKISLNTNEGNALNDIEGFEGHIVNATSDPTKTGHTFEGWYVDEELTTPYTFSIMPSEDIIIYAKWTVSQSTMTFDSKGGSSIDSITQNYATDVSPPPNPTRTGYDFGGWYGDDSLTIAYSFATMPGSNITLYAKWDAIEYNITYALDGGTNSINNPATYTIESEIDLAPAAKTGHTFNGWFTDTDSKVTTITPGSTETIKLYATYTINQYTATFEDYDGTFIDTSTVNYMSSADAPAAPTRTGYTFSGWDVAIDSITGDIDVRATYTVNQYTISFNTTGGSDIPVMTQDYNSSITLPSNPTRTGYTFSGWSETVPTSMPAENITLVAQWVINQYTATFKDYDGTVLGTSEVEYLTSAVAPLDPTRTGYTFDGWDVSFDSMTEDIEVTATYTANQFTATFEDYDGTFIDASTVDYLTSAVAPLDPTRTGYTFSGWDVSFDSMTEDITVTATYTINQYTISFNTNGGSDIEDLTVEYNTAITLPENPVKEGYIFNGWCQELPETMPAENLTLNTRWLKETHDNHDIETEVGGLLDAIDKTLIEGRDAEVIIQITMKALEDMDDEEMQNISNMVSNELQIRNHGRIYLDISVIIRAQGDDDHQINQLNQKISITLNIPVEQQGNKNYQIIRIHDGIAEVLESVYDEEKQTLTFETDRFSAYVIVYDVSSDSGLWWLFALIIIPIGYVGYRYRTVLKNKLGNTMKQLKKSA